ncbi:MAG TPA: DUF4384 domain-containing protein [Bryobacteraceae bacterium]|nr:DUF4384 domain-containing protein [Bryobacteraceae bacterium]
MFYASGISICAGLLAGSLCAAPQAADTRLQARELFYNTASAVPQAAAATPDKPPAPLRAKSKAKAKTTPAPTPGSGTSPSASLAETARTSTSGASGEAPIIPASAHTDPTPDTPPAPALGLKYTVVKLIDGQPVEVSAKSVFHAGDRVQFSVQPNGPGFLYILMQGSSGNWKPVFPSPEVGDASNRVDGWRIYTMPPKSALRFDSQTGTEKIFIVLSRVEVADLERLMYSLRSGAKPAAAPQDNPAPKSKALMAGLTIDDDTVGRLRQQYARDLIIEPVDEDTPGDRKEKALYVVNPTGSSESRVVADIELVHK